MTKLAIGLLALLGASPLFAGAQNFTLVNGTSVPLGEVAIRRAGTTDWKPLGRSPDAGARGPVKFADPDCAFDLRATSANGQPVTWAGVNLCDVKSVTLRKDDSAGAWVDYDQ